MTERIKWIDRKFSFDFPAGLYREILERLRGTPARVEERVGNTASDILTNKANDATWSIQEHVGHLISVEKLFASRLDDYEADRKDLTPADMSNQNTENANYNELQPDEILVRFRVVREQTIRRLEGYKPEDFAKSAHHPRLDMPMRLVDTLYFFADHDDFHLAWVTELIDRK